MVIFEKKQDFYIMIEVLRYIRHKVTKMLTQVDRIRDNDYV